ncbi:hypothetical protein Q8A73_018699 [Channa argus]|nr:hypothetical protein Q8A73_018699 [Channa argus]
MSQNNSGSLDCGWSPPSHIKEDYSACYWMGPTVRKLTERPCPPATCPGNSEAVREQASPCAGSFSRPENQSMPSSFCSLTAYLSSCPRASVQRQTVSDSCPRLAAALS